MRKDDQGDFVLAVENGVLVKKPVGAVRTWSRGELVEVKGLESGMTIVSAPCPARKPASGQGPRGALSRHLPDRAHPAPSPPARLMARARGRRP